ncbi:hypothetical protein GCK72_020703 [Caenorhabditis remanei]|uniref:F-box domain-containing protein n=1 Tax=Caenorhabditis remanei TaxID=31234 RepID=A0A6A5GHI3_CAERE|nr:hypothetical protein GCK72_020703 [Caenorhabditis remanei]KAF1754143.1 hypothetical protein GCK72_020703 [Caenorhabditis remanei]
MSQPFLLDMPENVMLKITEAVGFPSILTLRKVCRDYRNFIDDKTPNINLTRLFITVNLKRIELYCGTSKKDKEIYYVKHPGGFVINHNFGRDHIMENEEISSVFLRDFELIIKHQKSALEYFHFNSGSMTNEEEFHQFISPIFSETMKILKSRPRPLKVKEFKMNAFREEHVMSILPFLDANLLTNISMDHTDYGAFEKNDTVMKLNKILELPQWKNATNLDISHLYVTEPVEKFLGFTKVTIWKKSVSGNDLLSIKKKFLSPNNQTEEFSIFYLDFVDCQILGVSIMDYLGDQHWYYRTKNNEKILKISKIIWINYKTLIVSFIERSDVPKRAVVLA